MRSMPRAALQHEHAHHLVDSHHVDVPHLAAAAHLEEVLPHQAAPNSLDGTTSVFTAAATNTEENPVPLSRR